MTPAPDLEIAMTASSPSDEQNARSCEDALLSGAIPFTVIEVSSFPDFSHEQ